MRNKKFKTKPTEGNVPRLVQVIADIEALKKQELWSRQLEAEREKLEGDSVAVTLALLWVSEMNDLPHLLELKRMRAQAIREASGRNDLTISEGVRLYRAIDEELADTKRALTIQQKMSRGEELSGR